MAYNPNIPQPTDLISVSQPQLLTNFQQLDLVYGDPNPAADPNSDHYAYDDATPNARKHRKVRLVEQANDPAAVADQGSVYTKDVAGITELFYRYSNDATAAGRIIELSNIKAWVRFNGNTPTPCVIADRMNVASVSRPSVGVYTINFARPLGNATYSIYAICGHFAEPNPALTGRFVVLRTATVNNCQIAIMGLGGSGAVLTNVQDNVCVAVIGN